MAMENIKPAPEDIYYAGEVALSMLSSSDRELISIYDKKFEALRKTRGEPKSPEEELKRTEEIIRKFPEFGPAVHKLNDLTVKLYAGGQDC